MTGRLLLRGDPVAGREGRPPALKAIAPFVTAGRLPRGLGLPGRRVPARLQPALDADLRWPSARSLRRLGAGAAEPADLLALIAAVDGNERALPAHRRCATCPSCAELRRYYDDWLDHPTYDEFWRPLAPRERYERDPVAGAERGRLVRPLPQAAPSPTTRDAGARRQRRGARAAAAGRRPVGARRAGRRVPGAQLRAAWPASTRSTSTGDPAALVRPPAAGRGQGVAGDTPVRLFVMGANVWRDEDDWPLPDTDFDALLPAQRRPGQQRGGRRHAVPRGARATRPPTSTSTTRATRCRRSAARLLPGLCIGANAGPRDQRAVERRSDVLCYTTRAARRAAGGHRARWSSCCTSSSSAPRHRLHGEAGRRRTRTAAPRSSPTGSCAPATGTR